MLFHSHYNALLCLIVGISCLVSTLPTTRRSTSGYCVLLGNNLLSWSSKRHYTLSHSSDEAEYFGVANGWLDFLVAKSSSGAPFSLHYATIVYCDNVSAVYLSSNLVQHQRTKHIEIDIHFLRDQVAPRQVPPRQVRVLHVP
ncbi:ribonuclease H-like domain-containing protein [Tanacetum coccineum]